MVIYEWMNTEKKTKIVFWTMFGAMLLGAVVLSYFILET